MIYRLVFLASAMREWKKLGPDIRKQFKTKLIARLEAPQVERDHLSVVKDCYKIKLPSAGIQARLPGTGTGHCRGGGGHRQTRAQYRLSGGNKKDLEQERHGMVIPKKARAAPRGGS